MIATHVTSGNWRPHRLELIERRGNVGIFTDLDCPYANRMTCLMSAVTPTYENLKEWRNKNV